VVSAESEPVLSLPLAGRAPVHDPEAVQLVTFVVLQFSVVLWPAATAAGFADNVNVGAGGDTMTSTLLLLVPALLAHANENDVVAVNGPVGSDPDSDFAPDQPPLAEQALASTLLQLSIALWPDKTAAGLAVNVTDGAGGVTFTVTL
jgi:hypothetical protein